MLFCVLSFLFASCFLFAFCIFVCVFLFLFAFSFLFAFCFFVCVLLFCLRFVFLISSFFEIDFEIKTNAKKSRRFDLSEVIFK